MSPKDEEADRIFLQAEHAARVRHDIRAAIDQYLRAFLTYENSFGNNRFRSLLGLVKCVTSCADVLVDADIKALISIGNDRSLPRLYRAYACQMIGAYFNYAERIKLCERAQRVAWFLEARYHTMKADEKERQKILNGFQRLRAGAMLDVIAQSVKSVLEDLETKQNKNEELIRGMGKGCYALNDRPCLLTPDDVVHMLSIGGRSCDHCGKPCEEHKRGNLKACGICKEAYYCSRGCQAKQWREHKKHCRVPDNFQVGDFVHNDGDIFEFPQLFPQGVPILEVREKDPANASSLLLSIPGGNATVSCPVERLLHTRPLK